MDRVAEFTQLDADPSRVPLPKTPETKRPAKGERFRSTVGTPYFEDSHMLTPKKGKARGGRYDHFYDASDEAELGDSRDDTADLRGDRDEKVKYRIRRLSYDEAERDSSQYLELRTHFSLDKVAEFEGKRYLSDASLQWLKRYIYEMKAERFKLGDPPTLTGLECTGPPTLTGLECTGPPQSAEPAVEANHVFAFVAKAHRPEKWCVRSDGLECEYDGQDELGDPEEDRRAVASMATVTRLVAERYFKMMKLSPGERMGWWSAQKFDPRVRMRALVLGAVNDARTKILLHTGANVSAVSESFARRLHLKRRTNSDRQIDVQDIGKGKVLTSSRATVKVTLDWQVIYEFEVWIMPHHAGVNLILGTDFMIPAGIWLDLYNSTARLPDEVEIPLIKSRSAWLAEPTYGDRVSDGPAESLSIPARMIAEFTLRRKQPSEDTHEFWVRRTKDWIPTVAQSSRGKPTRVLLTDLSGKPVWCPAHFPVILWAPHGELPPDGGYVRPNSAKDGLHKSETTESTTDDSVRYEPAESAGDDSASSVQAVATSCELTDCDVAEPAAAAQTDAAEWDEGLNTGTAHQSRLGVTILEAKSPDQASEGKHLSRVDFARHETAELKETLRTARELSAELSADAKEKSPVHEAIDSLLSDEIEVSDVALADDPEEDLRLRFVTAMAICEDESITAVDNSVTDLAEFECSANEIDLEDYAHELAFLPYLTDSASTVLDYGGSNVRIIDNALWGYVQPRGGWASYAEKVRRDEAASATQRGRLSDPNQPTPDSVNSATKFEADHRALAESDPLQDLVNSPESDMFANGEPDESTLTPVFDRWSFVNNICFGGTTFEDCLATLSRPFARFAECRISIIFTKSIFVQPAVDFLSHEVSQHGIRANPAKLAAFAELPFPTSKKGMQGFLSPLNYYSRFIQNVPVYGAVLYQLKDADFADGGDLAAAKLAFSELKTKVANAPILRHFDSAREVHIMLFTNTWVLISFAVLLSPYHLKVKRIRELDADFAQFLQATVTPHIGLDESLSHLAPPSKNSVTVRLDPELLYAHVPRDCVGHVLSFDGSAKTEKNGDYGCCS
ncbi:unnamed protein product [Phytophthora fragariaefolia]|uniref:Unnamed protein product n=1 Tax=Phytophthora fragariaefolia TaxID=1490495 RepID=A0A9W6Y072_9STRA|nr:unnamed protein product [Phytophthora fragariaefolia]